MAIREDASVTEAAEYILANWENREDNSPVSELVKNAITLAEHFRAESDDTPVSKEWLEQELETVMASQVTYINNVLPYTGLLPLFITHKDGYFTIRIGHIDLVNRGQVRRLIATLRSMPAGIPLRKAKLT